MLAMQLHVAGRSPCRRGVAVSVMSWITSRPWCAESIDSDAGLGVLHRLADLRAATANAIHSSGVTAACRRSRRRRPGAITRILCSGVPVVAASRNRRMCGIWVAEQIVHSPPVGVDDARCAAP